MLKLSDSSPLKPFSTLIFLWNSKKLPHHWRHVPSSPHSVALLRCSSLTSWVLLHHLYFFSSSSVFCRIANQLQSLNGNFIIGKILLIYQPDTYRASLLKSSTLWGASLIYLAISPQSKLLPCLFWGEYLCKWACRFTTFWSHRFGKQKAINIMKKYMWPRWMAETKSTSVWQRKLSFMDTFAYKKRVQGCNMSSEDLIQQRVIPQKKIY